jgi:hypothetical protein
MGLKLVLMLAVQKNVQKLQVMEDSQGVINWLIGVYSLENFMLQPIYEENTNLKVAINEISFIHVYREQNMMADSLSKDGLHLTPRSWHIRSIRRTVSLNMNQALLSESHCSVSICQGRSFFFVINYNVLNSFEDTLQVFTF